jgi:hypothetical protein
MSARVSLSVPTESFQLKARAGAAARIDAEIVSCNAKIVTRTVE